MMKNNAVNTENDGYKLDSYMPTDYSDVGQGTLLAQIYGHCLCYCDSIGWLTYKGGTWTHSDIEAQGYSQKLTELQLEEASALQCANIKRYYYR